MKYYYTILTDDCKKALVEYANINDVHTVLNVTFKEALIHVWNIIRVHKESNNIKTILVSEMEDSLCKCFTGRLSRLVNCLNGFDERVNIKISDSSQINGLISVIMRKYTDIDKIKEEVKREMLERGYDEDTINEWLGYID